MPPSLNFASSKVITVLVGPGKKSYTLHQDLLCAHSPFFSKCLNGNFAEKHTDQVSLPEDSPDAFEHFVHWIYREDVAEPTDEFADASARAAVPGVREGLHPAPQRLPLAIAASTGTAYNKPAKLKSDAYIAVPLTLNGPSMRGVCRPIGDVVAVSVIVGIYNIRQAVCATSFRACIRQRSAGSQTRSTPPPQRSAAGRITLTASSCRPCRRTGISWSPATG